MTSGIASAENQKIIRITVIAVASIHLASLLFSEMVLNFFGISINSFRVAGVIVIGSDCDSVYRQWSKRDFPKPGVSHSAGY